MTMAARSFTAVLALTLGIGCGKAGSAETAGAAGEGTGSPWPKRATLSVSGFGQQSEAFRLADGALAADGDIALMLAVQLSLKSPLDSAEPFCVQGTFASLADVPVDETCPGSAALRWEGRLFLDGGQFHSNEESAAIGLSALVRSSARDASYRLRILGDSAGPNDDGSLGTATASFEYEPVSPQ